jgi:hypothetical protein
LDSNVESQNESPFPSLLQSVKPYKKILDETKCKDRQFELQPHCLPTKQSLNGNPANLKNSDKQPIVQQIQSVDEKSKESVLSWIEKWEIVSENDVHDTIDNDVPSLDEDEIEMPYNVDDDDISEMLTTHRPDFDSSRLSISDFNSTIKEKISQAVRHSLNIEPSNPSFTVASNLEQLLGLDKYQRLMKNLEEVDTDECSTQRSSESTKMQPTLDHEETIESKQNVHLQKEAKHNYLQPENTKGKHVNAFSDANDVKCAFSAEQIYAEAQRINLQGVMTNAPSKMPLAHDDFSAPLHSVSQSRDPYQSSPGCAIHKTKFQSSVEPAASPPTIMGSKTSPRAPCPAHSTKPDIKPKPDTLSSQVFQPRQMPFGPIPKSPSNSSKIVTRSADSDGGFSVLDSSDFQLAKKGRVPKFDYVPSVSFGDFDETDESWQKATESVEVDGEAPVGSHLQPSDESSV